MDDSEVDPSPIKGYLEQMDVEASNPGPIDASVLYDQAIHVSSAVWDGQERGMLRCHEHTSKLGEWRLTKKQIALVDKAGFGYLRLLPSISLDNPLISALVERWRKETNTFHFTVGEMTVTLEDVALLLGLPIDGEPVLGVTYTSCKPVCERFLGKTPEAGFVSGGMIKLSWLKEYFSHCREDAPLEEIEHHTRAYLLYLVGSTIFSTTTGNKVPIMYLPLFEDFEEAGKYAWGAAALAFLYRALGKASHRSQSTISGGLTMLQCWSYFHLNIGRPNFYQEPAHDCFPFVLRWKGKQSAAMVKRDLGFYRNALDSLDSSEVEWLPYKTMDNASIPERIRRSLIFGRSRTMLICFDKAERHLPDRCLRQYDMVQGIPEDVQQWERKTRGVDSGVDLCEKMGSEINEWSSHELSVVPGHSGIDGSEYMHWYSRITRKFIGRPVSPLPQFQRTVNFRTKKKRLSAGLRDIAHIADMFSTEGLDPIQSESISRIRAIAHDCLGDNAGGEIIMSSNMLMEFSKKREKEQVRRKADAKQKEENDQSCCPVDGQDSHSYLNGEAASEGQIQSIQNNTEDCSSTKLEQKMRKRGREKMKKNQDGKQEDDNPLQCDDILEDSTLQLVDTTLDTDRSPSHSSDKIVTEQLCHTDVDMVHQQPSQSDGIAVNEIPTCVQCEGPETSPVDYMIQDSVLEMSGSEACLTAD